MTQSDRFDAYLRPTVRDDPAGVLRPVLEDMSSDLKRQHLAMTICRRLILLHLRLPPLFSHYLFDHLIGMARDRAKTEKLESIRCRFRPAGSCRSGTVG
jgi:hypothetical protein